jgi:hypothetical protein
MGRLVQFADLVGIFSYRATSDLFTTWHLN